MRTVVHLSDLHFGADAPDAVAALVECLRDVDPHVVAVSGDLTQRARRSEFRRARAFLEGLPYARIVVPGNHDVPLYNLFSRFASPLGGFRRYITPEASPVFADAEVALIGADTTRSFTVKDGGLTAGDVRHVAAVLAQLSPHLVKIVVCHHPFDPPATRAARLTAPAAEKQAVSALVAAGTDIFLTGHRHLTYVGHTAVRYLTRGRSAIVVEAGSATSTRGRGEPNAFNVLRIDAAGVLVERLAWSAESGRFTTAGADAFVRDGGDWAPAA